MRKTIYFLSGASAATLPQLEKLRAAETIQPIDWIYVAISALAAGLVALIAKLDNK